MHGARLVKKAATRWRGRRPACRPEGAADVVHAVLPDLAMGDEPSDQTRRPMRRADDEGEAKSSAPEEGEGDGEGEGEKQEDAGEAGEGEPGQELEATASLTPTPTWISADDDEPSTPVRPNYRSGDVALGLQAFTRSMTRSTSFAARRTDALRATRRSAGLQGASPRRPLQRKLMAQNRSWMFDLEEACWIRRDARNRRSTRRCLKARDESKFRDTVVTCCWTIRARCAGGRSWWRRCALTFWRGRWSAVA
jgi:cobalamin biosynthesis protein CobT